MDEATRRLLEALQACEASLHQRAMSELRWHCAMEVTGYEAHLWRAGSGLIGRRLSPVLLRAKSRTAI